MTAEINRKTSRDIQVARLVLIFGIMYVHIPPNILFPGSFNVEAGLFTYSKLLLSNIVFIAGLPTLSLISGFLSARTSNADKPYGRLISEKVRSLIIPMVLVNSLTFAGYLLLSRFINLDSMMVSKVGDIDALTVADKLLALTRYPITPPLYFLRDLFLCFLMAPVLTMVATRSPYLLPVIGATAFIVPLYLQPGIFLFFCLGIMLAKMDPRKPGKQLTAAVFVVFIFVALAMSMYLYSNINQELKHGAQLKLVIRFSGPPFFWLLISSNLWSGIKGIIARFSKYSFLIFLLHSPIIMSMHLLVERTGFNYAVFYFMAPWLTMFLVIGFAELARRLSSPALRVLNGGRPL